MKQVIFFSLVVCILFSCNNPGKTDDTASKDADAKALYEKNLATLKTGITAFENEKIDDWAATVADNAVWNPPSYPAKTAGKPEWKQALSSIMADWDSLKLQNTTFLPGIDSATHVLDGSVRYYGYWYGVHKSGLKTGPTGFYGTYDFDKNGKIVTATEFYDVGGLMNAVANKPK